MNGYINYLLEANFGLLLFLVLYVLLLNRETDFSFKRKYLLVSLIVSVLFPLLKISGEQGAIPSISQLIPTYWLPEIVVTDGLPRASAEAAPLNFWPIVFWIYAAGIIFFALRLIVQGWQLVRYIRRAHVYSESGKYRVVEMQEAFPSFSFFHHIFIGHAGDLTAEDKALIIRHESVHADHFHSVDVLLLEVLRIAFWFNPLLLLYKKMFINLHEYQADAEAVEDHDVNQYCNLLAKVALMSADFKLANHFNQSLTLKRIIMMKSIKKKMRVWKIAAVALIMAGFFFTVACQDQVVSEATDIAKSSTVALDIPEEVQRTFEKMQKEKPNTKFIVVEVDEAGQAKLESMKPVMNELKQAGDKVIASMNVITPTAKPSEPVRTFVIVEFKNELQQIGENSKNGDVYTIVEESASPVGGFESVAKLIAANLQYPAEARMKGIEGTVFVTFIVNKDGSLSDFEVKKGVDPVVDKAALEVAQMLPAWVPGKQNGKTVRQQFVLPVAFRLGPDKPKETSQIKSIDQPLKVSTNLIQEQGKNIVKGTVTDASGNPLPGTNIVIMGTTTGTSSDSQGNFSLEVGRSGQLAVSFVGFKTEFVSF
ncbi:M56 family metallopeptidase [Chryseolinea soli]|uniref:TonB family protein n=1 Tax=Chryseolinea soli TaxID=2321403 RepID=A0A385SWY6_9BACT|nr:M56 family metallopeptidase [Chryseolinea soli]AYB34220.1 TonB family protein [Chryseolinea soli]